MSYGVDFQSSYVAASGGYQEGARQPWTLLTEQAEMLNDERRVTVVREFG